MSTHHHRLNLFARELVIERHLDGRLGGSLGALLGDDLHGLRADVRGGAGPVEADRAGFAGADHVGGELGEHLGRWFRASRPKSQPWTAPALCQSCPQWLPVALWAGQHFLCI